MLNLTPIPIQHPYKAGRLKVQQCEQTALLSVGNSLLNLKAHALYKVWPVQANP